MLVSAKYSGIRKKIEIETQCVDDLQLRSGFNPTVSEGQIEIEVTDWLFGHGFINDRWIIRVDGGVHSYLRAARPAERSDRITGCR